jgi:hypothetical protein
VPMPCPIVPGEENRMDLPETRLHRDSDKFRNAALVVAGAAGIFALNFIPPFDNAMEFVLLFGPLLTGIVMRLRGWPWTLGAASWALMGSSASFGTGSSTTKTRRSTPCSLSSSLS